MARTGKIARLPRKIRQELNQRLQEGECGKQLVAWLNGLPAVKGVMASDFGGREVNEVNLTEWRQGGFKDWERHQEALEAVRGLAERGEELEAAADGLELSERLSAVLAAELARMSLALLEETTDPEARWKRLREILGEVARLRRQDHRAARLKLERERAEWEAGERERVESERIDAEAKREAVAPILAGMKVPSMAQVFGGGEAGEELARAVLELQHDLKPGTLTGRLTAARGAGKEKINEIKPNNGPTGK